MDYSQPTKKNTNKLGLLLGQGILMMILNIICVVVPWSYIPQTFSYEGETFTMPENTPVKPSGYVVYLLLFQAACFLIYVIGVSVIMGNKKVNTRPFYSIPIFNFIWSIVILILAFAIDYQLPVRNESFTIPYRLGGGGVSKTYTGSGIYIVEFILGIVLLVLTVSFRKEFQ